MKKQDDLVQLVNISTQKWPPRMRTYLGALTVASPEDGQAYALTPVRACKGVIDMGDKHTMDFLISAREIAEDLARELNGDSGEGSFHGVFVAAGPEPTEAELQDARAKLDSFHARLVANADLEWARSHNPMFITDLERRAARELKLEKPWLYDPKPRQECPVCGDNLKPGVAMCRSCGAILDRDRAEKYGIEFVEAGPPRDVDPPPEKKDRK